MDYQKDTAISAILEEREYQDRKFGPENDQKNSIGDFACYLDNYISKVKAAITSGDRLGAMHAMRKVTALGLAAMETHGVVTRSSEEGLASAHDAHYGPGTNRPAADDELDHPFNEFLRGARVAADAKEPDIKFVGSAARAPEEVKAAICDIIRGMPDGVSVAHVVVGPPPFFGGSFFDHLIRR